MHSRRLRLATVAAVTLLAVVMVAIFVGLAPPAQGAEADNRAVDGDLDAEVRALKAISIPYGIASPLELSDDGRQIVTTGHGTCLDEGTFDIRVFIIQDTTDAIGMGRTDGDCPTLDPDEEWQWSAETRALTPPVSSFETGQARACASAEVRAVEQSGAVTTITKWWCKEVTLE